MQRLNRDLLVLLVASLLSYNLSGSIMAQSLSLQLLAFEIEQAEGIFLP